MRVEFLEGARRVRGPLLPGPFWGSGFRVQAFLLSTLYFMAWGFKVLALGAEDLGLKGFGVLGTSRRLSLSPDGHYPGPSFERIRQLVLCAWTYSFFGGVLPPLPQSPNPKISVDSLVLRREWGKWIPMIVP